MSLLAPLWLIAVAAMALPILYHLRRNTPPEVIRVGSVADLATGAATAKRRVPRDLLLLATRCSLLGVVALALAAPIIARATSGRRLVVAPQGDWAVVDSLMASGAARHTLSATDFPWSGAAAADQQLSPADTLMLVAPDDASRWIGPRPMLHMTVIVIPVPGSGTEQPGPPVLQRAPAIRNDDTAVSTAGVATLMWWLALALVPAERMLARMSPDAG